MPNYLRRKIIFWKRFIDDVFVIFNGTYEEISEFHKYTNNFHDTIKFDEPSYNPNKNSCYFLDLEITIIKNKIQTDLYKKPTYRPTTLIPSSAHPKHTPPNIIYSMLFRLMQICSTEEQFIQRYKELCIETLVPRGYDRKLISSHITELKFNKPSAKYIKKENMHF